MASTPIYTSEPMTTRALAAEIRHDPSAFTSLLERRFGLTEGDLGPFVAVQCEAGERIDLLLTYGTERDPLSVGLEAKFDHEITSDQLTRQRSVVDYLGLICLAAEDATGFAQLVHGVLSWDEVLGCFSNSRLTMADIESFPLTKRRVERLLRESGLPRLELPKDWDVDIFRGGSGMPSIVIRSPALPDGRELRGQIQVTGRGMPPTLESTRFEYHIGIQVDDSDDDLPDAASVDRAPEWIGSLLRLEGELDKFESGELRLSKHAAGHGKSGRGINKIPLVAKFMGQGRSWLAKGYTDGWALGIKSVPTSPANLPDLCKITANIFDTWFKVEQEKQIS